MKRALFSRISFDAPAISLRLEVRGKFGFAVAHWLWYGMELRILWWKDRKVPSRVRAWAGVQALHSAGTLFLFVIFHFRIDFP